MEAFPSRQPVGLIPKGHGTGKFRLIMDLSYPHGASVNNGIDPALTLLSHTSVDSVAQPQRVQQLGKGSLLAKMDIESAYRLIPVHPQDQILQAMEWEGEIYVDPMLPLSPKFLMRWRTHSTGVRSVSHYLDDFIIVAPPPPPTQRSASWPSMAVLSMREAGGTYGAPQEGWSHNLHYFLRNPGQHCSWQASPSRGEATTVEDASPGVGSKESLPAQAAGVANWTTHPRLQSGTTGRSFLRRLLDILHATNTRLDGESMLG